MDFEKMFQDEMDDVAKQVEAGLENMKSEDILTKDDIEGIVRSVVKEELAVAIKDIKKYINTIISESQVKSEIKVSNQKTGSSRMIKPNIDCSNNVSYNVAAVARMSLGMTCGGWTFFSNGREGNHLWVVNVDGTEYCELYPKTISLVSKIEDGYVYFSDADYNKLRVSISNGKVEKLRD